MQRQRDLYIDCLGLQEAEARWATIEARGQATPFQSFGWVSALAATVGRSLAAEFFVVMVRDATSGRDVMLLPLTRRSFGPVRVLEIPDFGLSDYCAPIIAKEMLDEPDRFGGIWRDVIKALPSADLIRVNKVLDPASWPLRALLSAGQTWRKHTSSWRVEFPARWEDYEAAQLSRNARSHLRRALKKLQATGPISHEQAATQVEVDEVFAAMCAQRSARFAELGRPNALQDPAVRDFYARLTREGLASGLATVSALRRGRDIVATLLGLHWHDSYLVLIPTMSSDEELRRCKVGKLMLWLHMKEMHARGCRVFDFTIGDEPYKRDFAAAPRALHEAVLPCGLKGYPLAWGMKIRAGLMRKSGAAATAD